ncbi:MAG: Mor transcription activator family protein [Campylobacteraceae bacterium]
MIDTKDIFLQFYETIKNGASVEDVCREYGGGSVYIPSFKSMGRNDEIREEYRKLITENKKSRAAIIRDLANTYNLSTNHIYTIINTNIQPSLFNFADE